MKDSEKSSENKKITLTLSWKLLSIVLAFLLVALTAYTTPWDRRTDSARTVTVSGEAVLKRAPDLFIYYPYYEAPNKEAIVNISNETVKMLKDLGLGDAGIQTSLSYYDQYDKNGGTTGEKVYTASLTLTVDDKEIAQKIQDFLITTSATGSISPSYDFTRETKKQLKDEATVVAIEDARVRAEKQAQTLGAKLGKVVNVTEPDNFDIYPVAAYDTSILESGSGASLPIQAGENEFTYSVKVEFEIR